MSQESTPKQPNEGRDPLDPTEMASLKNWGDPLATPACSPMKEEVSVDCGWGRLVFGQTFADPGRLAKMLCQEKAGRRDIAFYVREPNLVLSQAPQHLFLDPSLSYRLVFKKYSEGEQMPAGLRIRPCRPSDDQRRLSRLYMAHYMVPPYDGYFSKLPDKPEIIMLVAEDTRSGDLVGAITGVDHHLAFNDPDNGTSLWALAVDPQCTLPGVGEWLSRRLVEEMTQRGRLFMDLSVMHDNQKAIKLYEKLGFVQVPIYCVKNKNPINEPLFIGSEPEEAMNIYARLITKEARRRGISVDVLDAEGGFFRLTLGGRSITCRESLSELTSAVAMSRCDDKAVTRRVLQKEGLRVPEQIVAGDPQKLAEFLDRHERVVVKPARGEQGKGIQVGIQGLDTVNHAIEEAAQLCDKVLLEECAEGDDLRVVVINYQVVAAAIRRPPEIIGDGEQTIGELISQLSRRRSAATDGESQIPLDEETARCIARKGYQFDQILNHGEKLRVRSTANLHTGGTIHDVTHQLHSVLANAAIRAAEVLDIPVVGMDLIVPDVTRPDYVIIEANERPGLANHEPQPTVERFVDFLFPRSRRRAQTL